MVLMDTKEQILEAAEAAWVASNGVAPSIRGISTAAGTNIALVSYYFNNSNGLQEAVIGRCARRLRDSMASDESGVDKQLFNIVQSWTRIVASDQGIRLFIYGPIFSTHPRVVASRSAIENMVRQAATDAISSQSTPNVTPEEVVDVVFGPTLYSLLNWGDNIAPEALCARTFNHLNRLGLRRGDIARVVPEQESTDMVEVAVVKVLTEELIDKPDLAPPKTARKRSSRRASGLDFID